MDNQLVHIVLVALLNIEGEILLGLKNGSWGLLGGHFEFSDKEREKVIVREILEESQLEGIFDQEFLFSCDEQRGDQLYLFDVFTGFHYGETSPIPLMTEGISKEEWFSLKRAKKLVLTSIARRAINLLEKVDRSYLSQCRHNLLEISGRSHLQAGGGRKDLLDSLRVALEGLDKILIEISKVPLLNKKKRISKPKTVLVVDDDRMGLEIIRDVLSDWQFRVLSFSDPKEALVWLSTSSMKINSVIVDYHMPKMDGNTFIQEVRKVLGSKISFVLISGVDVPPEVEAGVTFFQKPINFEELIRAIN